MFRRHHDTKAAREPPTPTVVAYPHGANPSSGSSLGNRVDGPSAPTVEHNETSSGHPNHLQLRLGQVQSVAFGKAVDDPGYRTGRPHHAWTREFRKPWSFCEAVWREFFPLASQTVSPTVSTCLQSHTFDSWPCGDAQLLAYLRHMFVELGLPQSCRFSLEVLENWLFTTFCRYNLLPFHNFRHAFCVTQMMYCFIRQACLSDFLSAHDLLVLMFSAVSHDLDHPGFTNSYQVNVQSWLALRYNDRSPLENHHCATAFDLISDPATNLVANFTQAEYAWFRKAVIRCILATDLLTHPDCMTQFRRLVSRSTELLPHLPTANNETGHPAGAEATVVRLRQLFPQGSDDRIVLMLTLVKVCDISNEMRPSRVAGLWLDALLDEFFHQAEAEKRAGLPVSPHMDPEKVERAICQVQFIKNLLTPVLADLVSVLPQLRSLQTELAERLADYTDSSPVSGCPTRPNDLVSGQTPSANPSTAPVPHLATGRTITSSTCAPPLRMSSSSLCSSSPSNLSPLEAATINTAVTSAGLLDPSERVPSKCSRLTAGDVVVGYSSTAGLGEPQEHRQDTSPLAQLQYPHSGERDLLPLHQYRCLHPPRRRLSQQQPPSPTSLMLWSLNRLDSRLPPEEELEQEPLVPVLPQNPEAPASVSRKSSTGSMVSAVT